MVLPDQKNLKKISQSRKTAKKTFGYRAFRFKKIDAGISRQNFPF
jgi:hypothetical protein